MPVRIELRATVAVALFMLIGACSADKPTAENGDWQGSVETTGERTVVRNTAGELWGAPRELVRDLVVGVSEGQDEYMFGPLLGLAVTDERFFVVDYQVPAVRIFDHQGVYVGDLGGSGEGPGEYKEPDDVAVGPDGRIFVRETRRARIHVYSEDGSSLGYLPMPGGLFTSTPLTVTSDGEVFAPRLLDRNTLFDGNWKIGMVPHTEEGPANDRALVPTLPEFEPTMLRSRRKDGSVRSSDFVPFTPKAIWAMTASGAMVVGTGAEYRFEVRHADGTVTEVHRSWDPVPVQTEEANWHRRRTTARFRRRDPGWKWTGAEIPEYKAAFVEFLPGPSGHLWVLSEGRGQAVAPCTDNPEPGKPVDPCWKPTLQADVFDPQGRLLGRLDLPPEVGLDGNRAVVTQDALWAVVVDPFGVITVNRYRIETQEESANN